MGKTVVITGGNTGIGLAIAHELAARGATVCLACRNAPKAEAARADILRAHPGATVEVYSLDLASFAHIHRFVAEFTARHPRLDVLINNAGAAPLSPQTTQDGFELQFGGNYLGPFLLTHLLLPALSEAARGGVGDARIVHVSSIAHNLGRIEPATFRPGPPYRPLAAYAQSKLGNLMFNFALARRLPPGISTHAFHPGGVDSEIYRELPGWFYAVFRLFLIGTRRAGVLGADLALAPGHRSGSYETAQWPKPVSKTARDIQAQEALYAQSCTLAGVAPLPPRQPL